MSKHKKQTGDEKPETLPDKSEAQLTKDSSPETMRPKTLSEYKKLAEYICYVECPITTNKPSISLRCRWMVKNVSEAFNKACEILQMSRIPQRYWKTEATHGYEEVINGKRIAYSDVSYYWLYIALLDEYLDFIKCEIADGLEEFYTITCWPTNPKTNVFDSDGWSILEAMFNFADKINSLCDGAFASAFLETHPEHFPNGEDEKTKLSPKPDKCAENWRKHLSERLQREYPEAQWPEKLIIKEWSGAISQLEYDYQIRRGMIIPNVIESDWDVCKEGLMPISNALLKFVNSESDNWDGSPMQQQTKENYTQVENWLMVNISPVCASEFSKNIESILRPYKIEGDKIEEEIENNPNVKCFQLRYDSLYFLNKCYGYLEKLSNTIKPKLKLSPNASTKRNGESAKSQNLMPILQLIAQGENHTVEFKETLEYSVRESKQDTNLNKECLKTIAAFLNTDGGTLLIGVRDNGEITGIERDLPYVQRKNEDGFQLKLRDLIKSHFTPFPSGKVDIRFENFTKETVCRVDVEPVNKNQIIHLGKDVYIRDGNMTRKLEGPDLTYWAQQRGK